jgi:hypothetical protein
MKRCALCQKEITLDRFTGRQEQCPFCSSDLHCCLNCFFYAPGVYNDCKEPQAERVLEKKRSNFCDYFRFKDSAGNIDASVVNAKDKLEALFRK